MKIDSEKCAVCEACIPYCPVGVITSDGESVKIDQRECVECGTCLRVQVCPCDAIFEPPEVYEYPRSIRKHFSDPASEHISSTGLTGRGTAEAKTNDVTGRVGRGEIGIGIELGRPGVGAWFKDFEKITKSLSEAGFRNYQAENPLTELFDGMTGYFKPEVIGEKVLSAIIELKISARELKAFLRVLKSISTQISTVFSLQLVTRLGTRLQIPGTLIEDIVNSGFEIKPAAKVNLGLGKPLRED